MKRLLALLLALAMIFSLAACSSDSDEDAEKDPTDEDTEDRKDSEEDISYPIECTFELDDLPVTLTVQSARKAFLTFAYETITAEDLEYMEISVDDVEIIIQVQCTGSCREKDGIYRLTVDTAFATMDFSGDDAEIVREALLEEFAEMDDASSELYADLVNGDEVDLSDTILDGNEYLLAFELDGDTLVSLTFFEDDNTVPSESYTFYRNGQVKEACIYMDGELDIKYTYDRNGELTDSWYADASETDNTVPDTEDYAPWSYGYYADGTLARETYRYADGTPCQCWEYDTTGTLQYYTEYYEDGYTKSFTEYYANGNVLTEVFYDEYDTPTSAASYYEDGSLYCTVTYTDSGYSWDICYYYESGVIAGYESYEFDDLVSSEYYDENGNPLGEGEGGIHTDTMLDNSAYTLFTDISELVAVDGQYYTAQGYPVFIMVDVPSHYLSDYYDDWSLADYVEHYGDAIFDMTYWENLYNAAVDGYAPLNDETYLWLVTTISTDSWYEDESYAHLYMAYFYGS